MPRSPKPPVVAEPFVKWVGGKRQLVPEILRRLPEKIATYHEPFLGGGAVFFALAAAKRIERALLSDTNRELVNAFLVVRDHFADLVPVLGAHENAKGHYLAQRAIDPLELQPLERAARFLFLNRCGFNGLYRVNARGGFNVPFGDNAQATICDTPKLRACSAALKIARIESNSFSFLQGMPVEGDAVYYDPPYWPASKTANFTAYQAGGFGPDQQRKLRDVAERLAQRKVSVLLSNADVPEVRALYRGWQVDRVEARRSVNNDATKRGAVGELLIYRR